MPANGDYQNDWNIPLNADIDEIDSCFGGTTTISLTGVSAGTYALTVAQYRPPNIIFTGTIGGTISYGIPNGVGGVWSFFNNSTGANQLRFGVFGGGNLALPQGQRITVISDGTNVYVAGSAPALTASVTAAETRTSVAVPSNSAYLSIPLVTPGNYELILGIGFIAPSAAGLAFNVNYSGTISTSGFLVMGATGSVGFVSGAVGQVQTSVSTPQYFAPGTGALQALIIQGSIAISTGGTFAFSFSQQTINASPTTLGVSSYLKLTPMVGN
jgi:hypothetical protein